MESPKQPCQYSLILTSKLRNQQHSISMTCHQRTAINPFENSPGAKAECNKLNATIVKSIVLNYLELETLSTISKLYFRLENFIKL